MGIVIDMPARAAASPRSAVAHARSGNVVILPVIRIERHEGQSGELVAIRRKAEPIRKRRRQAAQP